jgi:lambda repressor-like predicted transcriptional regulator
MLLRGPKRFGSLIQNDNGFLTLKYPIQKIRQIERILLPLKPQTRREVIQRIKDSFEDITPNDRIKMLMKSNKISTACIARELNVCRYTVTGTINGDFNIPRVRTALSKALKADDLWSDIKVASRARNSRIVKLLHESGIKVKDIAEQLGCCQENVSATIHEKRKGIHVRQAIADALGMKIEQLWPSNNKKKAA